MRAVVEEVCCLAVLLVAVAAFRIVIWNKDVYE